MPHPVLITGKIGDAGPRLLFIEPYMNHSHAAFAHGLMKHVPGRWTLLGLPGRYFRWRMRGAAAFLATEAAEIMQGPWDGLVCSSMLNLAELKGLCPGLAQTPALVYFHENQICYPAPGLADDIQLERDLYLAFSNLTSVLAARRVLFNSAYHRQEVLQAADELIKSLPDSQPAKLYEILSEKNGNLPVPLDISDAAGMLRENRRGPLRIVWNHRWEHDKDPDSLFRALFELAGDREEFEVAVLGPRGAKWSKMFDDAPSVLGKRLVQLGTAQSRKEYWRWLHWADLAVSTALQEYQGLSVAEAVWAGCRPLTPDALVYPEIYGNDFGYPPGRLLDGLRPMVKRPELARQGGYRAMVEHMTWPEQEKGWQHEIKELVKQ